MPLYTTHAPLRPPPGKHAFWYNSQRVPELLRFEDAPVPGAAPTPPKRVNGALYPAKQHAPCMHVPAHGPRAQQ